jgi:Family of unknown function (DUF6365)
MKKNIVFISLGSFALGETIMALNFVRSLPRSKYRSCFILSPINSVLLKSDPSLTTIQLIDGGHRLNQLLVSDFLEHYPPDLFVLCDFLTFDFSQPEFGISLKYLRDYDKPIISLDSYEWESGDFNLDFFTGVQKQLPRMLLQLEGALRPCPLNKPLLPNDRVACYSFLHQIKRWRRKEVLQAREDLGIAPEDFVIFSAAAVWQSMRPPEKIGGPFGSVVCGLLPAYIDRLDEPLHWIRVGPERQRGTIRRGKVTEHNFPALPETVFDRMLAASDIFVTSNVASTTLGKCIRYGRSALLLYNSMEAAGPDDLCKYDHVRINEATFRLIQNAYPIHPFLMFPLGWYKFLSPVTDANPYVDTFYRAEILDEERVLSLLRRAMSRKDFQMREQREQYRRLLDQLPPPEGCLEHFLN